MLILPFLRLTRVQPPFRLSLINAGPSIIGAPRCMSNFTMTPTKSQVIDRNFWDKNKDLSRPMSPHLGIYKWQITMTLSIIHRATGIAASAVLYSAGLAGLLGIGVSFPEFLLEVQKIVPDSFILIGKTGLGGSIIYHTLNGIRHLAWDMGYGFRLKQLYLGGYVVVALSALGTALIFVKSM